MAQTFLEPNYSNLGLKPPTPHNPDKNKSCDAFGIGFFFPFSFYPLVYVDGKFTVPEPNPLLEEIVLTYLKNIILTYKS